MYMEAIEYYAAIEGDGEEKHQYFQEKLRRLLSNEKVHAKVQQEAPKEAPKPHNPDDHKNDVPSNHRFNHKKQMELNLIMGEKKAQDLTREMLKSFNVSSKTLNNIVKKSLHSQEDEIKKR